MLSDPVLSVQQGRAVVTNCLLTAVWQKPDNLLISIQMSVVTLLVALDTFS